MTTLRVGSTGSDVKAWQTFLKDQAILAGAADGIYGPATKAATEQFQNQQGLTADGIAGPATLAKAEGLGFQPHTAAAATANTFGDHGLNAVIDISHHNGANLNFQQAKDAGILAVFHKATQGLHYVDNMYATNEPAARAAGLLWGAYHFGEGADGAAQAEHFLDTVKPTADKPVLLVLDFENNPSGATMTLDQAKAFIQTMQQKTGRYPGLYGGSLIKQLLGSQKDDMLGKCWFWLAEYGPKAVVPPTWPTWTLWQYTDGQVGPEHQAVPGIGQCDRELFNGDAKALQALWT